jgi:hypothetical protein
MVRITTTIIAAALFASAPLLCVAAQEPPPPEGAPIQSNPYGEPGAPNANESSVVNKPLLAKAKHWFAGLQTGKIDRSQMESGPNANVNDATVANAQRIIGGLGTPVSFVQQREGTQGNITYAIYAVSFRNGQTVDFLFAMDSSGKVASLGLGTPH